MPEQDVAGKSLAEICVNVAMSVVLGMIPASAIMLGMEWLPLWAEPLAAGYLWIFGFFLFFGFSLACWAERNGPAIDRRQRLDPRLRKWRHQFQEERAREAPEPEADQEIRWNPIVFWACRLCILGIPVVLALSGWAVLAGFYGFVILVGAVASRNLAAKPKEKTVPERRSVRSLIGRAIRTLFRAIACVVRFIATFIAVTFWLAIGAICWLWGLVSRRGIARPLCESLERPEGLIYFVYSEPHQRDHFLGEAGPLQSFAGQVVARDWRADLRPMWEQLDWREYQESPEFQLLESFSISRIREHLPFIAVVSPQARIHGFKASKAYRSRRRDKGAALRKLEERIKKAANKALGIAET